MFNPIKTVRGLISGRKEKEDTGFTCSVYDLKNGETVLDTHDIDEFLRFLEELNKREPEGTDVEEEIGSCALDCDSCDVDCCDDCRNCCGCADEDEDDEDEDDTRWNELCVDDRPDIRIVQIPVKGVIAAGYLICSLALLIAAVKRK